MRKFVRSLSPILSVVLALPFFGCPRGDNAGDTLLLFLGGVEPAAGGPVKGQARFFLSTAPPLDASDANVKLPSSGASSGSSLLRAQSVSEQIEFSGFLEQSGQFFINTDFKGDNEFIFPITGQGNTGCIDFTGNGCDSSDVNIEYQPSQRSFQITSPFPAGARLASGSYQLQLDPRLFMIPSGPGAPADIQIQATRNSQPVEFTVSFVPGLVGYMSTVVVGEASGFEVESTVVINNAGTVAALVRLEFFSEGQPLALKVNGGPASALHEFEMPPDSSRRYQLTSEEAGLVSGWGIVSSDIGGVSASVVFTTSTAAGSGDFAGEAGVSTVVAGMHHVLDVVKTADGVDTALAISNPANKEARLRLTLKDENQTTIAEDTLVLGAKERTTSFFLELFELSQGAFSGTLVIDSENSIAVNTLKTLNGLQSSSLESAVL